MKGTGNVGRGRVKRGVQAMVAAAVRVCSWRTLVVMATMAVERHEGVPSFLPSFLPCYLPCDLPNVFRGCGVEKGR